MPIGPKGQKHPANVICNAIKVGRLATGEEDETVLYQDAGKDKAAHEKDRTGEVACTASMNARAAR